jgi:hypothetical protein
MVDGKQLLARQAEWQKARRLLPWPEKLRLVEQMREALHSFEALRASKKSPMAQAPRRDSSEA